MSRLGAAARGAAVPAMAVATAMAIGMIILAIVGYDPFFVYGEFLDRALGGPAEIGQTLRNAAPLILTGLSVALAFRAGLFNIGANGQAITGLIAGGVVAYQIDFLPSLIHVPVVILAAAAAGAVWAGIAGYLKVRTGAHEVVTTIMLNYIAIRGGEYLLRIGGPLQDGSTIPQSDEFVEASRFPVLWAPDAFTAVRIDVLIAAVAATAVWFLLTRTSLGLQIRVVGSSAPAGEYAGMNVGRVTVITMALAGALAGIGGAAFAQAPDIARLQSGEMAVIQIGFTGIAVALLGRGNPFGVVLAGLLFGAMLTGASGIQSAVQAVDAAFGQTSPPGLGGKLVEVMQGLIVLFIGADLMFRRLLNLRHRVRRNQEHDVEAAA